MSRSAESFTKRVFLLGRLHLWLPLFLGVFLSLHSTAEAARLKKHHRERGGVHALTAGGEGVAAYYSRRYEGRRTTSGEKYHADKLTAAHPDLPLGTLLRVVHVESGREVIVKVNDRCRRKRVPFIDLSRAAARELGFLGKGKARVRIYPVPEETTAAATVQEETE